MKGNVQWHADMGITEEIEGIKRTRSDAIASELPIHLPKGSNRSSSIGQTVGLTRGRSRSGDSSTLTKPKIITTTSDQEKSRKTVQKEQEKGHLMDSNRTLSPPENGLLRSKSCESVPKAAAVENGFCVLDYSEPEDLETNGDYTVIIDECEGYLSDEDMQDDSYEVKDLIPSHQHIEEDTEDRKECSPSSVSLPRATLALVHAFHRRIECMMINGVDYPPGLFFVQ